MTLFTCATKIKKARNLALYENTTAAAPHFFMRYFSRDCYFGAAIIANVCKKSLSRHPITGI
jgi:hypothetical protein